MVRVSSTEFSTRTSEIGGSPTRTARTLPTIQSILGPSTTTVLESMLVEELEVIHLSSKSFRLRITDRSGSTLIITFPLTSFQEFLAGLESSSTTHQSTSRLTTTESSHSINYLKSILLSIYIETKDLLKRLTTEVRRLLGAPSQSS